MSIPPIPLNCLSCKARFPTPAQHIVPFRDIWDFHLVHNAKIKGSVLVLLPNLPMLLRSEKIRKKSSTSVKTSCPAATLQQISSISGFANIFLV